jgi:hypothetical protein
VGVEEDSAVVPETVRSGNLFGQEGMAERVDVAVCWMN